MHRLEETAEALVAAGKGILAADESTSTIGKRFGPAGIPSTADTRRAYREMLFSTPGVSEFLSGGEATVAPELLVWSRFAGLALKAWGGRPAGVQAGPRALLRRARCNGAASLGTYNELLEEDAREAATPATGAR